MTRTASVVIVLVIVFAGYALVRNPSQAQVPQQRTLWEYKAEINQGGDGIATEQLNRLGEQGWELVSVWHAENRNSHFVLKRPK